MGVSIEGVNFNGGDAWDHVTFRGVTLNKRTAAFLLDVEVELGYKLAVIQGSYHPGVSQSGGTHDKGGVFDCWDVFNDDPLHIQRVLRKHGGFGWFRPTLIINGVLIWNQHIHCGVLGDTDMSPSLAAQVPDYRNYLDGLASHAADPSWHPFDKGNDPTPVFDYPQWLKEQDVQFDDVIPGTDNKKVGDALREALRGDEHAAAINANTNGFQAQANTRFGEQADAIKTVQADLDGVHDQLAGVQIKLTAILDAVKNP
jgi:hypothetical protein